ncbi:hypothetical protein [Arenimonas composti]|uniref:hypothetical protein n=1 Tax=Arenimonas composti TaxID=370776 RepID=UPI0005C24F31|nr:hypothetical protein [Arenimonas composti]
MTSDARKSCSICGKSFPLTEFAYGGKENRSYCGSCNKADHAARAAGGVEAARQFRTEQRAKWKH